MTTRFKPSGKKISFTKNAKTPMPVFPSFKNPLLFEKCAYLPSPLPSPWRPLGFIEPQMQSAGPFSLALYGQVACERRARCAFFLGRGFGFSCVCAYGLTKQGNDKAMPHNGQ
jgi:hypothetical protein